MKKLIVLAFLTVCFSIESYCQESIKISLEDETYFENTQTYELKSDLPDGKYSVYRTSALNILFCTGEILNKKKTGTWSWYNKSGLKLRHVPYINNKIHGDVLAYYPSGTISSKTQYSEGLRNGQMTKWYSTGEIKLEAYFSIDNPSGTWNFYDKEGKILKQENY